MLSTAMQPSDLTWSWILPAALQPLAPLRISTATLPDIWLVRLAYLTACATPRLAYAITYLLPHFRHVPTVLPGMCSTLSASLHNHVAI